MRTTVCGVTVHKESQQDFELGVVFYVSVIRFTGNTGLSDFRVQLEDLTADHTGASEDFSKTSDAPKTSRAASGSATASKYH